MKYKTELLFLLLILCICYIGCEWTKDVQNNSSKSDTVYLPGKIVIDIDTFTVRDSFPYPVPYAVKAVVKDSFTTSSNSISLVLCDSLRYYTNCLDDSAGMVIVNTSVQGMMLNQDITLQAYQKNTSQRDTMKIVNTETTKQKRIFAPTFGLRIDSVAVPSIGLMLSNKKGNIIYGGEVSTKKDVTLKVGINLNR